MTLNQSVSYKYAVKLSLELPPVPKLGARADEAGKLEWIDSVPISSFKLSLFATAIFAVEF
jgi:hypothetical protein